MTTTNLATAAGVARRPPMLRPRSDRRAQCGRDRLVERVRGEFDEMPCLSLTTAQAMRLFNLREDVCSRVLGGLVSDGVLCQRPDDRYVARHAR